MMLRQQLRALTAHHVTRRLWIGVGLLYSLLYLVSVGDIQLASAREVGVRVAEQPLQQLLRMNGFGQFEPIIQVTLPPVTLFIAPGTIVTTAVLGVLVGLNAALLWVALKRPEACNISETTGIIAALPALLSGAACCGPIILIVLGIQATSVVISAFQLAIPVSLILLVLGAVILMRRVAIEHL